MKLKDILDMKEYLDKRCYCKGEIYSIDGFFYQIFHEETECKLIGEIKEENNSISEYPIKVVISQSKPFSNDKEGSVQILIIMYKEDIIEDIVRLDATENNIHFIKDMLDKGKSDLKINEYDDTQTAKKLSEILSLCDAIMM